MGDGLRVGHRVGDTLGVGEVVGSGQRCQTKWRPNSSSMVKKLTVLASELLPLIRISVLTLR